MNQIIDILGSTLIGGFILLMIANSNIKISKVSDEILLSTVNQYDAVGSLETIDFDFYKIGYGISSNIKINKADSNEIVYYTDITSASFPEGDGLLDSIRYYWDTTNPLSSTPNPDDYPLYKIENNSSKLQIGRVTQFYLSYYDSLGNKLDYGSLNLETNRNRIKSINIKVGYESTISIDTSYKKIEWEINIRPKNLNL